MFINTDKSRVSWKKTGNRIKILKEEFEMNTETIIFVVGIISSLIFGFIGGFFAGAYWKTK